MVDRHARNETILAIEGFLDRKIMAFEFDERLQRIETNDSTVNWTILELWRYYDDCADHFERLGKREWKYLQRLRLLLASDCEIRVRKNGYCWCVGIAAVMTLGILAMVLFSADPRNGVPWGLCLSSWVAWWIDRSANRSQQKKMIHFPELSPFHSFSEIRSVRQVTPDFRTKVFPNRSKDESHPFHKGLPAILALILWVFYSPVILLLQVLQPSRHRAVVLAKP